MTGDYVCFCLKYKRKKIRIQDEIRYLKSCEVTKIQILFIVNKWYNCDTKNLCKENVYGSYGDENTRDKQINITSV